MEEQNKIDKLIDNVKEYANTRYELMLLKGTEKASDVISQIYSMRIIGVMLFLSVLLLSISGAFYLSSFFESQAYGFLIVGGVYLVVVLILIAFRKELLINPSRNLIIREMFKNEHVRKN